MNIMRKYKKDTTLDYGIGVFIIKSEDEEKKEIALPDKKELKAGYELVLVDNGEEKKYTIQEELTRVGETPLYREE